MERRQERKIVFRRWKRGEEKKVVEKEKGNRRNEEEKTQAREKGERKKTGR